MVCTNGFKSASKNKSSSGAIWENAKLLLYITIHVRPWIFFFDTWSTIPIKSGEQNIVTLTREEQYTKHHVNWPEA